MGTYSFGFRDKASLYHCDWLGTHYLDQGLELKEIYLPVSWVLEIKLQCLTHTVFIILTHKDREVLRQLCLVFLWDSC